MQSSLGVFIDKNIIKYAKLQKDKDVVKVDAYNVVFYEDNLEEIIKKIIDETYSYKIPVSINVSDEIYSSFDISTLLSKQDTKKAINIEYEMMCSEKGFNIALLDNQWITVDKKDDVEKQKIINIVVNKNEVSKRIALFDGNKVTVATPMSVCIPKLLGENTKENALIVNIESGTQFTTVVDGKVYAVDTIDEGMETIFEEINKIENSYSKVYEVCKNMTVYTQDASNLYSSTDPYMSIVTGNLLKIIDKVRTILNETFVTLDKIYITGTAASINNIDLFFQDYITNASCELLKPYFLKDIKMQTSIKEYIDVNSAIALALSNTDVPEINFSKVKGAGKKSVWKKEVTKVGIKNASSDIGYKIKGDFTSPLKSNEKLLIRLIFASIVVISAYMIISSNISGQLKKQNDEVKTALTKQNAEISKIDSDISIISGRTTAYKTLIQEITNPTVPQTNDQYTPKKRTVARDSIPNLLNQIMFVIPKMVKVISITNTTDTHIVIKAEAEKYEQLGYFKAVLSTSNILINVKSTPGQKDGRIVGVTIEGDLP